MDQQDNEVAHPGNSINTSKAAAFRLILQFAMDPLSVRLSNAYFKSLGLPSLFEAESA
jgi:hypothetical protein